MPRQELWICLKETGVPEKYVRIVQEMCEGASPGKKKQCRFNG